MRAATLRSVVPSARLWLRGLGSRDACAAWLGHRASDHEGDALAHGKMRASYASEAILCFFLSVSYGWVGGWVAGGREGREVSRKRRSSIQRGRIRC